MVGYIYLLLGLLFDIQTDKLTSDGINFKIRKSPRLHLEGHLERWHFQDIVRGIDPRWPGVAKLYGFCLGWIEMVRIINAVTLFGVGFGELFQPGHVSGSAISTERTQGRDQGTVRCAIQQRQILCQRNCLVLIG